MVAGSKGFKAEGELALTIDCFPKDLIESLMQGQARASMPEMRLTLSKLWVPDGFTFKMEVDQPPTISFSLRAFEALLEKQ